MAAAPWLHPERRAQLTPARLWSALEWPYGPADIRSVWKQKLGADFKMASRFLRPTAQTVGTFPCRSPGGDGCPRRVVDHGNGEIVAVCGDSPPRCDRKPLTREDILVYEVDLRKLCVEVAATLGLDASRPETTPLGTWGLGTVAVEGDHAPVHLALPRSVEDFRRTIMELISSTTGPFVVLTPLSHRADSGTVELIRRQRGRYLVLDELLTAGPGGELTSNTSLPDLLTQGPEGQRTVDYCFRRSGDFWEIAFRGDPIQLKDAKGLRCLQVLLQNPDRDYHPLQLEQATGLAPPAPAGPRPDGDLGMPGNLGPLVDERARSEIRQRLQEIDAGLAEAEANHDLGTIERLRTEKEKLESYLVQALGLGGRPRRSKDPAKQARDRVSQAVGRSRKVIQREHPVLEEHLTATLKGGTLWSYRPQQPVDWRF